MMDNDNTITAGPILLTDTVVLTDTYILYPGTGQYSSSIPVKIGSEPDRVLLGSAEHADDLGLRQIFAAFQIKSAFLRVESE
jgi:hypothetical protein